MAPKTIQDIENEYKGRRIPYPVLLGLKEWENKRLEILKRASNICERCGKPCIEDYLPFVIGSLIVEKPIIYEESQREIEILNPFTKEVIDSYFEPIITPIIQNDPHFSHIHHTYYITNRLPWEYPNESLILVCHKCHYKIHQEEIIKVYFDDKLERHTKLTPCSRCSGAGHLPEYDHVKNGVCFRCKGACFEEWI